MSAKKKTTQAAATRPPVVVVLGHVDHGKSSLLEAIKDFKITAKESGGITQHIGAYEVDHHNKKITFIDTPGHEAFSAMRTRGAEVADIALLVVDAAQSVQPQTKEAIAAIRTAAIPMIVVLNKIDLPTANPDKIKGELTKSDVLVESMGGEVPSVEVSAKEKTGISELLEMILLVADLHHLTADTKSPAEGLVIESYMDSLRGPVATVIIEKGILQKKAIIATETAIAKVRSLENFQGKQMEDAHPSQPAVVLGFETVPAVGEIFKTFANSEEAAAQLKRAGTLQPYAAPEAGSQKTLNIILKADVGGSLEAIDALIQALPQDKITLRVVKSEVGDINESDAKLAETLQGRIVGFRVKINPAVGALMRNDEKKSVSIRTFDVIYELIQDVRNGMEKALAPEITRQELGTLKATVIFWGEKNRQIVGGKITNGEITKGAKLEVMRPSTGSGRAQKIGTGKIINLQRDKKDVDKLSRGSECAIMFEGNIKVEQGDELVSVVEGRQKGVL